MSPRARYIVVEGPIGAGKTSLARRLAQHLDCTLLLEDPAANPFLPAFYREPARYALATQLHFLLQRVEQLEGLGAPDAGDCGRGTVADFMPDKDALFAQLNLASAELELYRGLQRRLGCKAPVPDLVIYLQAAPAVLLERVRRRRIDYEHALGLDYLERLCALYARYFRDYTAAPLLVVAAEQPNFVDRDDDFELLLQRIRGLRGPREYFSLG